MQCSRCGSEMRRLMRESFLQRKVYPLFGYYPWECPICRQPILFKKRVSRKRRSKTVPLRASDPKFANPGQAHSSLPASKTQ